MPDTAIFSYICNWSHGSLNVCSVVGVLVHGSCGWFGWLVIVFSHEVATHSSSFSPFFSTFIGVLMLSPMVGCKHAQLYLYDSGRASEVASVIGSSQ